MLHAIRQSWQSSSSLGRDWMPKPYDGQLTDSFHANHSRKLCSKACRCRRDAELQGGELLYCDNRQCKKFSSALQDAYQVSGKLQGQVESVHMLIIGPPDAGYPLHPLQAAQANALRTASFVPCIG